MGIVCAAESSSSLPLRMQQEQSCPLAMTPERDARTRVCCMVRATVSKRRASTEKVTGSNSLGSLTRIPGVLPSRGAPAHRIG